MSNDNPSPTAPTPHPYIGVILVLDDENYKEFVELYDSIVGLDADPKTKESLERLAQRPSPFDDNPQ